jgi:hypothetical protein
MDDTPVIMGRFAVCEFVPFRVTEVGESVQVVYEGTSGQASVTAWLKPSTGVTVTVSVTVPTDWTIKPVWLRARLKSALDGSVRDWEVEVP